ncbi:MAG: hypothetical protein N2505_00470 [Endomicrobia bacterium]|nr:hypothetical protein [Endomicrobiia bacterium]
MKKITVSFKPRCPALQKKYEILYVIYNQNEKIDFRYNISHTCKKCKTVTKSYNDLIKKFVLILNKDATKIDEWNPRHPLAKRFRKYDRRWIHLINHKQYEKKYTNKQYEVIVDFDFFAIFNQNRRYELFKKSIKNNDFKYLVAFINYEN